MLQDASQCRDVVLVFGAFECVLQHRADVLGSDPFHLPVRIQTLALFLTLTERNDIVMARIAFQACDQLPYLGGRPLDPIGKRRRSRKPAPR